jgi:hypothetical protein
MELAQDKAREQFEAWAKDQDLPVATVTPSSKTYDKFETYIAWGAWQAATAAASQDREELVRELEDIRYELLRHGLVREQEIRSIDALIAKHRS